MWQPLKGLLETTWKLGSVQARTAGITFLALAVVAVTFNAINDVLLTEHRVLWLSILTLLYFLAVVPPVANMTKYRHKHVLYVVLWGLISLAFVLVVSYLFFFAIAQTDAQQKQWDRILNLPPILAAAIAAAIGWYAAHQFSAQSNRTNSSFSLVMQTRCNDEFVMQARCFSSAFPPPIVLDQSHQRYFSVDLRGRLDYLKRIDASNLTPAEASELQSINEQVVLGMYAARYLLNFYEFMAYAIYAGDLDEDLLYETISPAVVGLFDRVKALRDYINVGATGDKLAFQHVQHLVEGYVRDEGGVKTTVDGWRRRLDKERAALP
jgi:hypothetical protein